MVPVWLHHERNPDNRILVYAVLDDQSDACFIKKKTLSLLGIEGPKVQLALATVLGEETIECEKINGLKIRGFKEREEIQLPGTYSRDSIPAKRSQIPRSETTLRWNHLRRLEHRLMPYDPGAEISLLIGINCIRAIKPRDIIPGANDEPYAQRTALGWGIVGFVGPSEKCLDGSSDVASGNRILCREVRSDSVRKTCHFVVPVQTKEVFSPLQVRRMFELDFNERDNDDEYLSSEDMLFMNKVKDGIHHLKNYHYEIPLPFKTDKVALRNNKEMALRRLQKLKNRLKNDPQYRKDYLKFMDDLIDNEHAERVPLNELIQNGSDVWYLPNHGVYHPRKPKKIRVVFDCSADFQGESLNQHLLSGPDLTNNLVGVLCRFRQKAVAVTCDIESMFHQVRVNQEHRDYLRFLWWEDGMIDHDPTEFRMTVHLFGAASSPGCVNFALKRTADEFRHEFGVDAAEFVKRNFYVDDGLKSVTTPNVAIDLVKRSKLLCSKGGFNLHKFVSNSKRVLNSIPSKEQAKGISELDLSRSHLPVERTLGVQWCVESDSFQFRIELKDRPLTRRGILATVSSIFDPLGLISPFLLIGKQILRELCRDSIDWDERVPDEIRYRWERWRNQLYSLTDLKIPRCYEPEKLKQIALAELHNFSDASQSGYGQCSYLRLMDEDSTVHCCLVMAKSRVYPVQMVTIPRLELTAAFMSSRISSLLCKELEYENLKEFFWTDSRTVLGYIGNDVRRFHVFVANRVQQIKDKTTPSQWHYVTTKDNPADLASRGATVQELINNLTWWTGPNFLWNPSLMKKRNEEIPALSKEDPKVRKVLATTIDTSNHLPFHRRLEYFSSWLRAKRATAICLRLINGKPSSSQGAKVSIRVRGEVRTYTPANVEEIKYAEHYIVKSVQRESFPKEVRSLITSRSRNIAATNNERSPKVNKARSIYRLDPFVDQCDMLRVGGRIKRAAEIPEDVRHPVLLPKKGHIS